jgi:hypothetical protein
MPFQSSGRFLVRRNGAAKIKSLPEKLLCEYSHNSFLSPRQYQRDRQPLYVLPLSSGRISVVLNCAGDPVLETDLPLSHPSGMTAAWVVPEKWIKSHLQRALCHLPVYTWEKSESFKKDEISDQFQNLRIKMTVLLPTMKRTGRSPIRICKALWYKCL